VSGRIDLLATRRRAGTGSSREYTATLLRPRAAQSSALASTPCATDPRRRSDRFGSILSERIAQSPSNSMARRGATVARSLKVLRVGLLALVVTTAVSGLWSALVVANLKISPAVPWASPAMAVLLWVMWRYAGGRWWPNQTAHARRLYLRANRVSIRVFMAALVAGACSLVALAGIWIVLFQTGVMRGNRLPDFSQYPLSTVVAVLVTASLVGGLVEEAGFRGYF